MATLTSSRASLPVVFLAGLVVPLTVPALPPANQLGPDGATPGVIDFVGPGHLRATGFSEMSGYPQFHVGAATDGGMLVDMDGDPELELVEFVSGKVLALNPDGSAVPGWPVLTGDSVFSAPAFGDIDGDGEGEVVVQSFFFGVGGQVYAFHRDGTTVDGFPLELGGSVKAPALVDVDGDDDLEILTVQNIGSFGNLFVVDGDGTILPGWPQTFDDVGASGPSAGDLDGNGTIEIVAPSFRSAYVFGVDGASRPGFPYTFGGGQVVNYSTIALADLDVDSDRELVLATCNEFSEGGRAYVLHHDGTVAAGWPRAVPYFVFAPVAVADIDGDGWLDLAVGDQVFPTVGDNYLHAWDRTGAYLPGFPVGGNWSIHSQVVVADIDGDTDMEEFIYDENLTSGSYQAVHHDGTPASGWPLTMPGSSFIQMLNPGDVDGDGDMEAAGTGRYVNDGNTDVHLWTSSFPWSPERVALGTYQYDVRRSGWVPDPVEVIGVQDAPDALVRTPAATPNPFRAAVAISAPASTDEAVTILDVSGRVVRTLPRMSEDATTVTWDGRAGDGRPVPAGVYWAHVPGGGMTRLVRIDR